MKLTDNKKYCTEKEIKNQPVLWGKIYDQILFEQQQILKFLNDLSAHADLNVILTGAGSSAYVGLSVVGSFKKNFNWNTSAVSTTDIVTHPCSFLTQDIPVLLISFARSGNSPESVAAVKIAEQICSKIYHLIITCDLDGDLAKYETNCPKYVIALPEESNDKGLAMTGSYSGMLLAGLLVSCIHKLEDLAGQVNRLIQYGEKLINQWDMFQKIAEMDFERVVFLGSGPMFGTATESQLKIQELTDGTIICKHDSFLGFRHGPKAVINQKTLIFSLFSNQAYANCYEKDLIDSLDDGQKPIYTIGLAENKINHINLDKLVVLSNEDQKLNEEFLPVCFILPAQMIGFFKSIQLGLNPDMPSKSGAINRVVKGVIIYPYTKQ
ncbi:MAG: SIS domain-containing protein [Prolixibacteraceae bacterium]|nr:SIS domain-containing protein [Prolixibacteraceae bacterium]